MSTELLETSRGFK